MTTCEYEKCRGHLAKFDSCVDEAIWLQSLDQSYWEDQTGDADFEGHVTLMSYGQDIEVGLDPVWILHRDSDLYWARDAGDAYSSWWTTDRRAAQEWHGESTPPIKPWGAAKLNEGTFIQDYGDRFVTVPAGWYLVMDSSSGHIYVERFDTEPEARQVFDSYDASFAEWVESA